MKPQVIVADDLTGACDTGAAFATAGTRVHVFGEFDGAEVGTTGADIIVVDCDTRHRSEDEAFERVAAVLARVRPERPEELFIKIDSTLRGPIAGMVRAALAAFPDTHAVAAPAFPGQHRITRNGLQLVDGLPVHVATAFDARAPIRISDIAQVIGMHERVRVYDAENDADLDAIALKTGIIWIGSAGIAAALARKRGGVPPVPPSTHGIVILAGTNNIVTHGQLAELEASGVVVERVMPGDLLIGNERLRALRRRLKSVASSGASFALALDPSGRVVDHASVLSALCGFFTGLPYDPRVTLLATGGETARALCGALGIHVLQPIGEVAPGIPLSFALGRDVRIITKAGGFGEVGALARIAGAYART